MTSFLGIGSNIGDRKSYLEEAIKNLRADPLIEIQQISDIMETDPYGKIDQEPFLNCVVEIITEHTPRQLLECCLRIEARLGRIRKEKWGPRTIDIDILTYGDLIVEESDLTIPHADLHNRKFILKSLKEIAPDLIHPVFKKSMNQLLQELQ